MNQRGTTLIEVLAVISMITVLFSIGVGALMASHKRTAFGNEVADAEQRIEETQSMSRTSVRGLKWGMECNGATFTRFGITSTGVRSVEEATLLPSGVNCNLAPGTVIFAKLTGVPDTNATLTLTRGTQSALLTIAQPGIIDAHIQ
ncbi:MAG: prepilin-type N-terminal cleavage/methylation domain-containing protein [Patescibacteria group bacterium]|jgi:prepilin-type N-terminal cleavage/methylation domain-containing protein